MCRLFPAFAAILCLVQALFVVVTAYVPAATRRPWTPGHEPRHVWPTSDIRLGRDLWSSRDGAHRIGAHVDVGKKFPTYDRIGINGAGLSSGFHF